MKKILMILVVIPAAALLGNVIGAELRFLVTGRETYGVMTDYRATNGVRYRNIPVITKFYPGVSLAWAGDPPWLYAFIGGLLAGGLLDDRLEMVFWEQVSKRIGPKGSETTA